MIYKQLLYSTLSFFDFGSIANICVIIAGFDADTRAEIEKISRDQKLKSLTYNQGIYIINSANAIEYQMETSQGTEAK